MECCDEGVTLETKMQSNSFNKFQCVDYFIQMLEGFRYLWIDKNIVHRDIKQANIIFKGETLKIIDFGSCKILNNVTEKIEKNKSVEDQNRGTEGYKAYEIISNQYDSYDINADVYSLGVVWK